MTFGGPCYWPNATFQPAIASNLTRSCPDTTIFCPTPVLQRLPSFERLDSWFSAIAPQQMGSLLSSHGTTLSSIETPQNKLPCAPGFWAPSGGVDFRKASPVNSFGQFPWNVPGTDCKPKFPHQMNKLRQTCPPYPGILDGTCHKSGCTSSVYKNLSSGHPVPPDLCQFPWPRCKPCFRAFKISPSPQSQ